jgi:hypothetical protein
MTGWERDNMSFQVRLCAEPSKELWKFAPAGSQTLD